MYKSKLLAHIEILQILNAKCSYLQTLARGPAQSESRSQSPLPSEHSLKPDLNNHIKIEILRTKYFLKVTLHKTQ